MEELNDLQAVLELSGNSGKLVLDEAGHTQFLPSEKERKKIETYLREELTATMEDYKVIWAEAADNIATYKATKITVPESGESVLPSPIARIPADQIIAWAYNTIMRPRPIFSFDAYFPDVYDVAVPLGMPDGGMTPTAVKKTAEAVASTLESGVEFKCRERLDFDSLAYGVITDCVKGAQPWAKVVANTSNTRTTTSPTVNGAVIDFSTRVTKPAARQDVVTWHRISVFNAMMPVSEDDVDVSPWWAERTPLTPNELLSRHATDEYFLLTEKDATKLAKSVTTTQPPAAVEVKESTQSRIEATPRQKCDVWQVWFYWNAKYKDPETGQTKVKKLSLIGDYHFTDGKLCNLLENEYPCRPVVPFWQMQDPDSHAGSSTVGILKYHQKIATYLMQAEIKNAFHANNLSYWYDENGASAEFFETNKVIKPGAKIPGKGDEDFGSFRAGADHYSLLQLRQAVLAEAQQTSNVSSYETGDSVPGRTPAATIAQILQQGMQQPNMFLRNLNRQFSRLMRIYLETVHKYQPMGDTIPLRDGDTKELMEVPFRLPVESVLDNFRISLTAADEVMAKEQDSNELSRLRSELMADAQFVATVAGPMLNASASPATVALFKKILDRDQQIMRRSVGLSRSDVEDFDLTPEIEALVGEREAALQAIAAQPPQMGDPNAQNQAPEAGGVVPGPPGIEPTGDVGGGAPTGDESGVPPDLAAGPPIGVPAPSGVPFQ